MTVTSTPSPNPLRPSRSIGKLRIFKSPSKNSSPKPSPTPSPRPDSFKNLPPLPKVPTFIYSSKNNDHKPPTLHVTPPSTPQKLKAEKATASKVRNSTPNSETPVHDVFMVSPKPIRAPAYRPAPPPRTSTRPKPHGQSSIAEKIEKVPVVAQVVGAMDTVADSLGGYDKLDLTIAAYHPTMYAFVAESYLSHLPFTNRPTKFLICLVALCAIKSLIPLVAYPVDIVIRATAFAFLTSIGTRCLNIGFTSGTLVISLLVTLLISTGTEVIVPHLIDLDYHLGSNRSLLLPLVLLVAPPDSDTIAAQLADRLGHYGGLAISNINPIYLEIGYQTKGFLAACIISALFWTGALGAKGSYATIWLGLAFQTARALATPRPAPPAQRHTDINELARCHNILAIWLLRVILTGVERLALSPFAWLGEIITRWVPTYHIWMTALFAAMLVVDKTYIGLHANTWYARWLLVA